MYGLLKQQKQPKQIFVPRNQISYTPFENIVKRNEQFIEQLSNFESIQPQQQDILDNIYLELQMATEEKIGNDQDFNNLFKNLEKELVQYDGREIPKSRLQSEQQIEFKDHLQQLSQQVNLLGQYKKKILECDQPNVKQQYNQQQLKNEEANQAKQSQYVRLKDSENYDNFVKNFYETIKKKKDPKIFKKNFYQKQDDYTQFLKDQEIKVKILKRQSTYRFKDEGQIIVKPKPGHLNLMFQTLRDSGTILKQKGGRYMDRKTLEQVSQYNTMQDFKLKKNKEFGLEVQSNLSQQNSPRISHQQFNDKQYGVWGQDKKDIQKNNNSILPRFQKTYQKYSKSSSPLSRKPIHNYTQQIKDQMAEDSFERFKFQSYLHNASQEKSQHSINNINSWTIFSEEKQRQCQEKLKNDQLNAIQCQQQYLQEKSLGQLYNENEQTLPFLMNSLQENQDSLNNLPNSFLKSQQQHQNLYNLVNNSLSGYNDNFVLNDSINESGENIQIFQQLGTANSSVSQNQKFIKNNRIIAPRSIKKSYSPKKDQISQFKMKKERK